MKTSKLIHDHYGYYAICPHCGEAESLTDASLGTLETEGKTHIDCSVCNRTFKVVGKYKPNY